MAIAPSCGQEPLSCSLGSKGYQRQQFNYYYFFLDGILEEHEKSVHGELQLIDRGLLMGAINSLKSALLGFASNSFSVSEASPIARSFIPTFLRRKHAVAYSWAS